MKNFLFFITLLIFGLLFVSCGSGGGGGGSSSEDSTGETSTSSDADTSTSVNEDSAVVSTEICPSSNSFTVDNSTIDNSSTITDNSSLTWKQLSEEVDHDELVYKLTLKYLRRDGYDIGNNKNPEIKNNAYG